MENLSNEELIELYNTIITFLNSLQTDLGKAQK